MQPTFFNIAIAVYLCMGFLKFMLLVVNLPTALATMVRMRNKTPKCPPTPTFWLAVGLVAFSAVIAFATWPAHLKRERLRFFSFYTTRTVMQDIIRVYRHPKPTA